MQPAELEQTFGNETGRRPAKRQRIARACVPCRSAKLKCDGQQPNCSTCDQLEKSCTYEATAKRRGLRSGYVRALELLWGLTLQEVENVESVVDELLGRLSKEDLAASADRADNDSAAAVILDRWKQSEVVRHLNDLLNEADTSTQDGATTEVNPRAQDLRPSHEPSWKAITKTSVEHEHVVPISNNVAVQQLSSGANRPQVQQIDDTNEHQAPAYIAQLLQLFLNHTQSWFPIFERHILLKTSFQQKRNSWLAQHGNAAALHGVYAYSSVTFSHLLTGKQDYQHAMAHNGMFYAQAYSMLPLDSDRPAELGHVQCALLLSLTRLGSGASRASWRLVRIAIQLLHELMRQDQTNCKDDALGRAWLGCFVLDTITSACLKHRPSLHFNDIARWCSVDENGVEEWQPWQPADGSTQESSATTIDIPTHSISLLVLQVKLLRIVNSSLHDQSSPAAMGKHDLDSWIQELTSYLHRTGLDSVLKSESADTTKLPPSFLNLSIMYTNILAEISRQDQEPNLDGDCFPLECTYPQISNVTLRTLKTNSNVYKQLPSLQLFDQQGQPPGLNMLSGEHLRLSRRDLQQQTPMAGYIYALEQPAMAADGNALNASTLQPSVNAQDHMHGLLASSTIDVNLERPEATVHSQDSIAPSLDIYLDGVDAPFLDYLDTLDDRSINDDLFNKSLGYSF